MKYNENEIYRAVIEANKSTTGKIDEIVKINKSSNETFSGNVIQVFNNTRADRTIGETWSLSIRDIGTYFTVTRIYEEENPEYFI